MGSEMCIRDRHFYSKLCNRKERYPWNGLIELTYSCNFDCIHCYCKGSEDKNRELTTQEWKGILDEIHKQGCLWLTFSGGEPLIRDDFLELYSYAKGKGFIITLFTNGALITGKIIDYLQKSPPECIEITLNGISKATYEGITRVKGSFQRVISVIKELTDKNLPLILKSNCLKQNKNEIGRIKAFADELLGKGNRRWKFKYDPMIYPRLNGDRTPVNYRLSFEEMLELRKQDPEILEEYERGLKAGMPVLNRDRDFLYRCSAWFNQFFINPYGILKFCQFSERFSTDLRRKDFFHKGFYEKFPRLLRERFKTNSKCKDCSLRVVCYSCPARNFLEAGNEEAPVEYYCELAKATAGQMQAKC